MSGNRVVAVIDDDAAVLVSMKFLIELYGYKVTAYDSALGFLNDRHANQACVITDQQMPHMSGLKLAELLDAQGDRIPILLVTASPTPAIVARAELLGIEVLEKPVRPEALLRFLSAHS
jgi:two-component system, LuxR family, response regulator FixJ